MMDVIIETGSWEARSALHDIETTLERPANLDALAVPVLVSQSVVDDSIYPSALVRLAAAAIPGAQLVTLDGSFTKATNRVEPIRSFLQEVEPSDGRRAEAPATEAPPDARLSPRELEVLRLVAEGRTNPQIADELVIAPNTVARHVKSILAKTGAANRTETAMYASRHGLLG